MAMTGAETLAANRFIYGKLAAALGERKVWPGIAPAGTLMPYVLYQHWPRPGGGDTTALGGIRVLTRLRYLVKVEAKTLASAQPLLESLDTALQDTEGQSGALRIGNVQRVETYEQPTVEEGNLYWQIGGFYDLEVSSA